MLNQLKTIVLFGALPALVMGFGALVAPGSPRHLLGSHGCDAHSRRTRGRPSESSV